MMLNERISMKLGKNLSEPHPEYMISLPSGNTSHCLEKEYPYTDITNKIIFCGLEVHSRLGPGLLENLYEEALALEFELSNLTYERHKEIFLQYKGRPLGKHEITFLVENKVVVEIKAVGPLYSIYETQMLTFLKAMNKKVGLLFNFNTERFKDNIKKLII